MITKHDSNLRGSYFCEKSNINMQTPSDYNDCINNIIYNYIRYMI